MLRLVLKFFFFFNLFIFEIVNPVHPQTDAKLGRPREPACDIIMPARLPVPDRSGLYYIPPLFYSIGRKWLENHSATSSFSYSFLMSWIYIAPTKRDGGF